MKRNKKKKKSIKIFKKRGAQSLMCLVFNAEEKLSSFFLVSSSSSYFHAGQ
jgi:hypothetical protein